MGEKIEGIKIMERIHKDIINKEKKNKPGDSSVLYHEACMTDSKD